MKKSDFNIPYGKLEVFLESCRSIIRNNHCYRDCENCPFNLDVIAEHLCEKDIENAKQFIELFGGSMFKDEQELYRELQRLWVEFHNVEVGDVVRVVGVPVDHQCGWGSYTNQDMNGDVGNEFEIYDIFEDRIQTNGYNFPFFCLEFVRKAENQIEEDFNIGDIVKLKSGSPNMTVNSITERIEGLWCKWFVGTKCIQEHFYTNAVEKVDTKDISEKT